MCYIALAPLQLVVPTTGMRVLRRIREINIILLTYKYFENYIQVKNS